MKEGLIEDSKELVIKEMQTLLSILYLLMIGIGMLFNYKKYAAFNINIFEYAGIFDFLIAPFQDYRIALVSFIAIFIPLLVLWIDLAASRRFPKTYSILNFGYSVAPWYQKLRFFAFGLLILVFILETSTGYANFKKKQIATQTPITLRFVDNEIIKGQMIGKTKEMVFLWIENKVKIIPITSVIKEMVVE